MVTFIDEINIYKFFDLYFKLTTKDTNFLLDI